PARELPPSRVQSAGAVRVRAVGGRAHGRGALPRVLSPVRPGRRGAVVRADAAAPGGPGGGRVGGGVRGDAGVRVGVAGPADLRVLLPRADSGQVARDVRRGCLAGAGAPPRRGRRGASRAPRGLRGRVRVSEDGRLAAAPRRASPAAAERAGRAAARGGGGTTGARGPGGAGRPGGRRPDCRPGEGVRGGAGPGACGDRSRAGQDLRARDRLAHRGRAALPRGDEPPDAGSEVGPARLSRGRPVPKLGAAAPMLVNLVPEFLAVLAAPDPLAAYHDYLDRHRPVLASYWRNYVLDPDAPQAEPVIAAALRADRTDLRRLLEDVDVVAIAEDALRRALDCVAADCPVDLYVMVGMGAANAGELVVGGRGIAFVCLEHFTGRPNPQTYGLGLAPHLLPLWIAHEVAHAVRYTSPPRHAARAARERRRGRGGRPSGGAGVRAVGILRLHPAPVPARARARRVSAARRGAVPRPLGAGPAVAVPRGRGPAGSPAARREGRSRAVGLLSGVAAGGELPRRAGLAGRGAGGGGGVPAGGRARRRDPERMSPRPQRAPAERRRNRPLREVLDDLLAHARDIASRANEMSPAELEYAQHRLEWLADEVWRAATAGAGQP